VPVGSGTPFTLLQFVEIGQKYTVSRSDASGTVNILFITQKRIYYKKIALINLFKAMSTIISVLTEYML